MGGTLPSVCVAEHLSTVSSCSQGSPSLSKKWLFLPAVFPKPLQD